MNDESKPVDRCVCFNIMFEQMKAYVEEHNADLDGLQRHFHCGRGCGLCLPYIKRMLKTGETRFAVMPMQQSHPDDDV